MNLNMQVAFGYLGRCTPLGAVHDGSKNFHYINDRIELEPICVLNNNKQLLPLLVVSEINELTSNCAFTLQVSASLPVSVSRKLQDMSFQVCPPPLSHSTQSGENKAGMMMMMLMMLMMMMKIDYVL